MDGVNLRPQPSTKSVSAGELPSGYPIVVSGWVSGEEVIKDNPTWAILSGSTYLYSSVLRPVALPSAPPPPEAASGLTATGRWIDLNLLHQVVVAYEGDNPVRLARTSTGRPGWETAPGMYTIQRRVDKETMESSSLLGPQPKSPLAIRALGANCHKKFGRQAGFRPMSQSAELLGLDAQRADYKVENVRWTQHFTADGKALHENYWKPRDEFGIPCSHGCAGFVAEDARADVGVPVLAH